MINEDKLKLIEFGQKTFELTRAALTLVQEKDFEALNNILDNRERAINIMMSYQERVVLSQKTSQNPELEQKFNNQVTQLINRINDMDAIITECLTHEKSKTQIEIAKTHKNKQNFKGYNLNNTK